MRLEGIDLLRGIAVITVLIYHFFALLGLEQLSFFKYVHSFGTLGVSLFFVISGYLIYRSLTFSVKTYGKKNGLIRYALHRFFRIVPAYYVNFIAVLLLATFVITPDYLYSKGFLGQILSHLSFSAYFVYKDTGLGVNGAYWTLDIEMLWYIVVAFLFVLLPSRKTWIALLFISLIYLCILDFSLYDELFGLTPHSGNTDLLRLYYASQLPGMILYFAAGVLLFRSAIQFNKAVFPIRYMLALFLLLIYAWVTSQFNIIPSLILYHLFTALIVTLLFILLFQTKPHYLGWLSWIGKISYSMYLWHMPILFVMKRSSAITHLSLLNNALLFSISLLMISALSYYLIEESGFNWRRHIEKRLKEKHVFA